MRVGEDYFIATSTFEYHPGVRIHHSTDLVNWRVLGHALDEGFDLRGIPDSGGVWAPSLSYSEGKFWLAYSIVRTTDSDNKDIDNYLITAPSASGPWSKPVHLGSRGFDFSFFHDADGSHWIVGLQWDHRPEYPGFSGLVIEQYLPHEGRVSGQAHLIYQESGLVEGPNLYQFDGRYYLLMAAGGTGWNHAIAMARSDTLLGPYERDPEPVVLTSRDAPGHPLQKAGHGELVSTPNGNLFLAHLASRPTLHLGERYSTLGREVCLQKVVFTTDGWLRLHQGGHHAEVEVETGLSAAELSQPAISRVDFGDGLDSRVWSTLRAPLEPTITDLLSRPGWLRLRGGHSTGSVFDQSMVVQRIEEHRTTVGVTVEAQPSSFREAAGLVFWYDRSSWIWLQITHDSEHGHHARVVTRDGTNTRRGEPIGVPEGEVRLIGELDGPGLRFTIETPEGDRMIVPETWDAWRLSDDHGDKLRFTGVFFGLRCEDLDSRGWTADFSEVTIEHPFRN